MQQPYPLRFKEILRNYQFGARWIASAFEKTDLPADHTIGETWEICDRPGESSQVINGPLSGKTLRELIDADGRALLGDEIMTRFNGRFPLLIKLLDATHPLSEQAHHNDDLARAEGLNDPGKTEAWYMLRTGPGATVDVGHHDGLTRDALVDAILSGDVVRRMNRYPVNPGDALLLYAGAMHHSDGGVLFYEIMQNSDVYIGLRPPKADLPEDQRRAQAVRAAAGVHLEEGADYRTRPVCLDIASGHHTRITACQHFALERFDLTAPYRLDCDGRRFCVLTVIDGQASVVANQHTETLRPGQSCMLPANAGPVTVEPAGSTAILNGYVPDLRRDVIAPLRAAGVPDSDIASLGATTRLNPIVELLN